jgi:transcriptional regulator with XRE-family HTH domain
MRHRDYVAARETRDAEFRAERAALQPEYDYRRALIEARLAAGLTQQQLADRLGTHQSAIARMESGKHVPAVDTLRQVATITCGVFTIAPTHGLRFQPEAARTGRAVAAKTRSSRGGSTRGIPSKRGTPRAGRAK